jgi:RND family efflux transporter MFP subunit
MHVDERLSDLLVEWEQARRAGHEPSLEELCEDTPDLLPIVRESIDSLKATDWMFSANEQEEISQAAGGGPSAAALHDTELPASQLTVAEFAASIFQSGLLARDEIDELKKRLDASELPSEARAIASKLVTEGKLTRYQASVLLKASKDPLLVDNYVILESLDTGGMGLVFKALHRSMNRVVALKLLPAAMMSARDNVRRFHREVKAAAALQHPNIVAAYDADASEEVAYLVLEYVEGRNLFRLVKEDGPLPVAAAVDYVRQAACGLGYLHSRGIIHRDVKPANLILASGGTVKLLDMGLVRFASSEDLSSAETDQDLTQAGIVIGTVAYMSPEQALDTRAADQRSDIYSLGCTLFYLLTGRSLYHEETGMKTLLAHREQPVPTLRQYRDDVPASLDAVFRTMVAKRPADRLQTMEEVIAALDACVPSLPSGPPVPIKPAALPKSSRWRRIGIGAAILAVAAFIGGAAYFSGILIRIKSDKGTTELWVDDPNASVEVTREPRPQPSNKDVPSSTGREQQHKAETKQGLAHLVEEYNRLVKQERWAEACSIAKQAQELDRQNPMATIMFEKARIGQQNAANADRSLGAPGPAPVPSTTAVVRKTDFNVHRAAVGMAVASQTVTIRSRVDGEIVKIAFTEGKMVRAGDLLIEIDNRPYKAMLAQAEAQLVLDEKLLTQAQHNLDRGRQVPTGVISPAQLEAKTAAADQCEKVVKTAQAAVGTAKLQLSYCRITAPISGRIGLRLVDKGNIIRADNPKDLAVINQVAPIDVVFRLPQQDIARVQHLLESKKEIPVEILTADTTSKPAIGKLESMNNEVDSATGSVKLKATYGNADGRLFPNQSVTVRFTIETLHDAIIVPQAATFEILDRRFVYVVKPNGATEQRKITVAAEQNDEFVLTSGLSEGEVVANNPRALSNSPQFRKLLEDPQRRQNPAATLNSLPTPPPSRDVLLPAVPPAIAARNTESLLPTARPSLAVFDLEIRPTGSASSKAAKDGVVELRAGGKAEVDFKVRGFKSSETLDHQFTTYLQSNVVISDPKGEVVTSIGIGPAPAPLGLSQPRILTQSVLIEIPPNTSPGTYSVIVTVKDLEARQQTQLAGTIAVKTRMLPAERLAERLIADMQKESKPDRAVAEWVLFNHGAFRTKEHATVFGQGSNVSTPAGNFHIVWIRAEDQEARSRREFAPISPLDVHPPSEIRTTNPSWPNIAPDTVSFPKEVLTCLRQLDGLKALEIHSRSVPGEILTGLSQLESLDLADCGRIIDGSLAALAGMAHLRTLNLTKTSITDAGLRELIKMKRLTVPNSQLVVNATSTTETALTEFQRATPGCTVSANHLFPDYARMTETAISLPPLGAKDDAVWADWILAKAHCFEIRTDLDPETWIKKASDLPPITFQIKGLRSQLERPVIGPIVLHRMVDLKQLESLDLNESVPGLIVAATRLRQLKSLAVKTDTASNDALKAIATMTNLRSLRIDRQSMTDADAELLAPLHELETLEFVGPYRELHGACFKSLRGLKNLKELGLPESGLEDRYMGDISQFTNLEGLNLSKTWISVEGLRPLDALTHLKTLRLAGCRRIGPLDKTELEAFKHLYALRELDLYQTRITRSDLDELKAILPKCHIVAKPE